MVKIPTELRIRGDLWAVVWHTPEDKDWRREQCWGMTDYDNRRIHLCDSLRVNPMLLQTVWIHELLHACIPTRTNEGRPRALSVSMEEKLAQCVAETIAQCLNQSGWEKLET